MSEHTTAERPRGRGRSRPILMTLPILALLLLGLIVLAGCSVSLGLDTKVEEDGSGTVSVRLAADDELQDALSQAADRLGGLGSLMGGLFGGLGELGDLGLGIPSTVDELFDTILGEIPGDWEVQRGTDDDGTQWLAMTRPFADPEELEQILASSTLASVVSVDSLALTRDEGFFRTTTRFSATADVGGALSQLGGGALGLPLDMLSQVLVIENRVTLPGTVGDNNADEVQGNTLVWNLATSGTEEMYAESVTYNWAAIIGLIVAGAIVIAALVVIVVLLLMRRRPSSPAPAPVPDDPPVDATTAVAAGPAAIALPPADAGDPAAALPAAAAAPALAPSPDAGRAALMESTVRALGAAPVPPPPEERAPGHAKGNTV